MKLILENWRKYLKESMDPRIQRQVDAVLANPGLGISIHRMEERVEFHYVRMVNGREQGSFPGVWGEVIIRKAETDQTLSFFEGHCYNGWIIASTVAGKGWGPLLYELALEYASHSLKGGGLTSDRYAIAVWDKYMARPDVDQLQMDVVSPDEFDPPLTQLTPDDPEDDCAQFQAVELGGSEGWADTSLSKMYHKPNTEVMDALEAAGRIIIT